MKASTPESREVELEFGWSGLTLAGTLHLPEGELAPGYLDLITDWAARRVAGR